MWLILGFRPCGSSRPPAPFFVGIFTDLDTVTETCSLLNGEKKDVVAYEVKPVKPNKVYDYEWNVMDEWDYLEMIGLFETL